MSGYDQDDDLAYGEDHRDRGYGDQGTDRGLVGDALRKLKSKYQQSSFGQPQPGPTAQQYYGQPSPAGPPGPSNQGTGQQPYIQPSYGQPYGQENQPPYNSGNPQQQRPDLVSKLFGGLQGTVQSIGSDVAGLLGTHYQPQQQGQYSTQGTSTYGGAQNRFDSFAAEKPGNDVKWYVDGCGYMWAVSKALEGARESIWILDWWLSPELYLRRPPSLNEQWRLDRTLQRAAQRGVKVNIIVYKEVTQALTRKYLTPIVPKYLHSLLPRSTDVFTSTLVHMGLMATSVSMEYVEAEYPLITPPVTVSSAHTKHTLEALHPNIAVFRHPDHLPDARTAESSLISALQGLKLDAAGASKLGIDSLKALYGFSDDQILFWAHHEKLCLIDSNFLFMGGLDLCFGRWDTNQHTISDVHPGDLNLLMFPGQDYNNGRIMDFNDVAQPFQNKLDRTQSSRMGWSDISISLRGACVDDLRMHFINRWNFIFDEKYNRNDPRYSRLSLSGRPISSSAPNQQPNRPQQFNPQASNPSYSSGVPQFAPPPGSQSTLQPGYQPTQQPGYTSTLQPGITSPQPPGSQYTQPSWQASSRPHTPDPNQGQLQPAPYAQQQPPWQASSMPHTPDPNQGQLQQAPYAQQQPPYQANSRPHTPDPSQTQFQQTPYATTQPPYQAYHPPDSQTPLQQEPYYPPPPPGPPPVSPIAPQSYGGAHGSDPRGYDHQNYQPPADVAELSTIAYRQAPGPNAQGYQQPQAEATRGFNDPENPDYASDRGLGSRFDKYRNEGRRLGNELGSVGNMIGGQLQSRVQNVQGTLFGGTDQYGRPLAQPNPVMSCQVVRSCTKWSNGTPTEHSVQNAYIQVITSAQHFIYIENQFFITATGNNQNPVKNQIGKALLDRILRAARAGEPFKVIVLIPSVPGFAGDLRDESSLGTRAIMEFQYNSINRGEHSIMQQIAKAGFNPLDYIRFYNLRNYDRINAGSSLSRVEQQSGVSYEDARRQHDDFVGAGYGGQGEGTGVSQTAPGSQYQQYQATAQKGVGLDTSGGRWDSVAACYMLNGPDIRTVPWSGDEASELHAFVSEELYIHSKVLIADDRIVICGSANLNDRSMLGSHDSEIALVISDPTPVSSYMAGQPWQASRFAASLRRQLVRKHLGLVPPQNPQSPDANFEPVGVPNAYDWGTPEDNIVSDPLSPTFQALWNSRARTNTEVFRKVFHVVPDDDVTSWTEYKEFFEYYFRNADLDASGKGRGKGPARYGWGHIVAEDFPGGVREVKEHLSQVKGTLVEMPLCFLQGEDIAKMGLSLNPITQEIYT